MTHIELIQENIYLKQEIEELKEEVKRFEKEHPCCAYTDEEKKAHRIKDVEEGQE